MKHFVTLCAAALVLGFSAFAQEDGSDFAEYGVGLGISPFGPSVQFVHNFTPKTSLFVGVGAFSGDNPVAPEIGGSTFDATGETQWVGFFLNHRPFEDADWFRFNAGIGIGGIEGELTDQADATHTYNVRYQNNPVGYVGVGVGSRAKQGITVGFDLGMLHTGGPTITGTGDLAEEVGDTFGYGRVLPNLQLSVGYGF
ncbi:MAG: hypothetical protein L7S02_05240 [Flavobacteriales bacterium]|nr:hypothetical protein [Flavobacteriales bacterium]